MSQQKSSNEKQRLKDLADGEGIEDKLMWLIYNRGGNNIIYIHHPGGYFKDYDIAFKKSCGNTRTVEVKYDRKAGQTGNVAFEYEYYGKPSGVFTTKADVIMYYVNEKFYRVKKEDLIDGLETLGHKVIGGDNKASSLYLLPLTDFEEVFRLL